MFEILKDLNASVESLSTAYVEAIAFEKKLEGEKAEAHRALMIEQRDYLDPGTKPSKKLIAAKDRWQDTCNKIEAVQFGKQELKTRIGERLQVETQKRLEQIEGELELVASKEKKLQEAFLDSAAKAAVTRELIRGQALTHDNKGNYRVTTPSLEVKLHLMDSKDQEIYSDRVKYYREEMQVGDFSQSIRGRRDDFVRERGKLEKSLQSDPLQNAQELLDKLCPPPTPDPVVVAGRPRSHPEYRSKPFEKDYGEITVEY